MHQVEVDLAYRTVQINRLSPASQCQYSRPCTKEDKNQFAGGIHITMQDCSFVGPSFCTCPRGRATQQLQTLDISGLPLTFWKLGHSGIEAAH